MVQIALPISKSMANRLLVLQSIHGDELMPVSAAMADDVRLLHHALSQLRAHQEGEPLTLYLHNCGTALRFLQVHCAVCYPNQPITLDGDERLKQRDGQPTSQTTSAWIMHGKSIPTTPDESPYITMTRRMCEAYPHITLERDWSAAAFWYEYIAIHSGELLLEQLTDHSLQGDRAVADIYAQYFGVSTQFTADGAILRRTHQPSAQTIQIDFTTIPDLYPAIAITCEHLGIELHATGTANLRHKESDRLEAVRLHQVRNDHRIAMALMAADYTITADEQQCISKSYPQFVEQYKHLSSPLAHVTPIRGVNDDNKGKKHALSKLIHATNAEYIWMHDDDIILPPAAQHNEWDVHSLRAAGELIILPLTMESEQAQPNLLERLQMAEYAAIQQLTIETAQRGRAVMCSGANLIVQREVWLECETDLHPDIPSGDDMFLLEAIKRRGMRVGVMDHPDYTAIVRPISTWRALWRQRTRWAGKAPAYTDKDIIRCGVLVAAANILQLICPLLIIVKFPIEYRFIRKRAPHTHWATALLLEIIYPFYMLIVLLGGLFRSREW